MAKAPTAIAPTARAPNAKAPALAAPVDTAPALTRFTDFLSGTTERMSDNLLRRFRRFGVRIERDRFAGFDLGGFLFDQLDDVIEHVLVIDRVAFDA